MPQAAIPLISWLTTGVHLINAYTAGGTASAVADLVALTLGGKTGHVSQERLVGPFYDLGLVPEFDVAIVVVAVDLSQRERLPVNLDCLSAGLFYLRQPHGCIVNEGSTKIVKSGELDVGHSVTSQNWQDRAPMRARSLGVRLDCIYSATHCQSTLGSLFTDCNVA